MQKPWRVPTGPCSNRKKRMKQLQKKIKTGTLNLNQDDPFELFIAATNIRYCYYNETHKILGNTFGMCVLQVSLLDATDSLLGWCSDEMLMLKLFLNAGFWSSHSQLTGKNHRDCGGRRHSSHLAADYELPEAAVHHDHGESCTTWLQITSHTFVLSKEDTFGFCKCFSVCQIAVNLFFVFDY